MIHIKNRIFQVVHVISILQEVNNPHHQQRHYLLSRFIVSGYFFRRQ